MAPGFSAQNNMSWLADPLVLLAVGVGILLTIYLWARRRQTPAGVLPARAHAHANAAVAAGEALLPPSMQALRSELEAAVQRASAQIDDRIERLEALMRQADVKLAALSAALARAKAEQITQRLVSGAAGLEESGLGALSRHNEIYVLADAGRSAREIAQELSRPSGEVELILALRGSGA